MEQQLDTRLVIARERFEPSRWGPKAERAFAPVFRFIHIQGRVFGARAMTPEERARDIGLSPVDYVRK
eukprot:739238-Lingulodinium_polyedra.AAC.1